MKKNYEVKIGVKYDKLTALSIEGHFNNGSKKRERKIKCSCDCGNLFYAREYFLVKGKVKSCRSCAAKSRQKIDIKKLMVFNRFTVIDEIPLIKYGRKHYKCRCDCGNEEYVEKSKLTTGKRHQCTKCSYKERPQSLRKVTSIERLFNLSIIHRAKGKNIPVDISISDFEYLIKQPCYYCGSLPISKNYIDIGFNANGIDRVDNTKGYVKGNCVPCCTKCNTAKGIQNLEDFINHTSKIYFNLCQKQKDTTKEN